MDKILHIVIFLLTLVSTVTSTALSSVVERNAQIPPDQQPGCQYLTSLRCQPAYALVELNAFKVSGRYYNFTTTKVPFNVTIGTLYYDLLGTLGPLDGHEISAVHSNLTEGPYESISPVNIKLEDIRCRSFSDAFAIQTVGAVIGGDNQTARSQTFHSDIGLEFGWLLCWNAKSFLAGQYF